MDFAKKEEEIKKLIEEDDHYNNLAFIENVLANTLGVLTADIRMTFISLIIAFFVYKLSKFYLKVFSLPPGPIPLPIFGNLLYILGTKQHWSLELQNVAEKYGPVFTFWMGTSPTVFISDIDIAQVSSRKIDFAGKPVNIYTRLINNGKGIDVSTADYGPEFEVLKRVAHSAIQKYSKTDKLVDLSSDCVDHTIKTMLKKEGLNKPFDPSDYIFNTFVDISLTTAFGSRLEWDDPDFKSMAKTIKLTSIENSLSVSFFEIFPFLMKIFKNCYKEIKVSFVESIDLIGKQFRSHQKDYNESVIRDFCDSIITAKNDALREGKELAPYLKDENLILVVFDYFFAGTFSTTPIFNYILFYFTYYPEIQKKLRQEIENQIGDRIPTHEDRNCCHYVMAFISEVLRLRNVGPVGDNHKAMFSSKISNYDIPEGTRVSVFQGHILQNEKYWPNGQEFRPERFLKNGKYVTTRPKAYIPFGTGRRGCPAERLAIAELFLVLVRFLQNTVDYELVLHYSGDTLPNPNKSLDIQPKDHKISIIKNKLNSV